MGSRQSAFAMLPQAKQQSCQRQRQEPAHLRRLVRAQQTQGADGRVVPQRAANRQLRPAGCRNLVAIGHGRWGLALRAMGEARQSVVDERQLEHGVAVGAAGIGPAGRGNEIVDDRPCERDGRQHDPAEAEPHDPAQQRLRPPQQEVRRRHGWHEYQCCRHLDVEGEPDACHRREQPSAAAGLQGPHQRTQGQQQHHDETAVGIVGAVDGDADGHEREEQRRQQAGQLAERAPHQDVNQHDGDHAFDHLGQQHGEAVEPEHLGGGDLQPERDRRLVERDEACGIEGIEEEIVPAPEHAAHARGVVGAAPAVLRQPQRAQDDRENEYAAQGQPRRPSAPRSCRRNVLTRCNRHATSLLPRATLHGTRGCAALRRRCPLPTPRAPPPGSTAPARCG